MKDKSNVTKLLTVLLCLLLAFSVFMLVACNDDASDLTAEDENNESNTPSEEEEETETPFMANMDFSESTSAEGEYPLVPSSWSVSSPATSLPQRNDEDDAVEAGTISVDATAYDSKKSVWDSLANPGKNGDVEDNNMLMIYNRKATVYGYTSSSFTIAADTIYKLTIDVKTVNIAGRDIGASESLTADDLTPGALLYVGTSTYAQMKRVNTNGAWQTYTFYIAGNVSNANTLTLKLALGEGTSTSDTGLTKGYVFFDNITVDKTITAEQFQSAVVSDTVQKCNMRGVGNGEFEFGSNAPSGSASLFTNRLGEYSDDDNMAPTSNVNRKYGLVDTSNWSNLLNSTNLGETVYWRTDTSDGGTPTYSSSNGSAAKLVFGDAGIGTATGTYGSKVYMLYQSAMTAQYIQANTAITIERAKCYELTVYVYTKNVFGAGVTLSLIGGEEDLEIEGISKSIDKNDLKSTGGWVPYSFWIKGNPNRNLTYNLRLSLGTGGISDNTKVTAEEIADSAEYKNYYNSSTQAADFSANGEFEKTYFDTYKATGTFASGWAFFDGVTLTEYTTDTEYAAAVATPSDTHKAFDLSNAGTTVVIPSFDTATPDANVSLDDDTLGLPNGWTLDLDDGGNTVDGVSTAGVVTGVVDTNAAEWNYSSASPKVPYGTDYKVLMVKNGENSLTRYKGDSFTLTKNSYYRVAIWVKTVDMRAAAGVHVTLCKASDDSELSAFTLINTAKTTNKNNDWQELVFKVQSSYSESVDLYLKLSVGTGTRFTPDTLANGAAYFFRANMEKLSYKDYSNIGTGTYVKAVTSLASSSTSRFTNGTFNNYDNSSVVGIVNGEHTGLDKEGNLSEDFGTPSSWTLDDNKLEKDEVLSGIVDVTNATLLTNLGDDLKSLFGTSAGGSFTPTVYDGWPLTKGLRMSGEPNLLMISNVGNVDNHVQGYTSSSFSMSASSYYKITVWVKTFGDGTVASICLNSENNATSIGTSTNYFISQSTAVGGVDWTQYTFAVKIGLTSVSDAKLSLWLGVDTDKITLADTALGTELSFGTVLFDSVDIATITEKEFDAIAVGDTVNKLSFYSDSFDSIASTDASRTSVITPGKWSGAVVTEAASDKTVSGIVDTRYVDISATFGIPESSEDFTAEEIANSKIPASLLTAHTGARVLVINNRHDNGYTYTSGTYSFTKETYYKVSLWAKTYAVAEGEGAYIKLYLNSDHTLEIKGVNEANWTEYTFYVATSDTSLSPYVILGLGEFVQSEDESGYVSGYAMFDDVTIETVTEADFTTATSAEGFAELKTAKAVTLPKSSAVEDDKEEEEEEQTDTSSANDLAWLWISSIVVGGVTIVVVVLYFFKKFYKPRKKEDAELPTYDKDAENVPDVSGVAKEDKYKDFND